MNASPPFNSILSHLRLQSPLFHRHIYTFLPSLSSPSSANLSLHLNLSARRYPILSIHTLQMSKPPQSASTHYIRYTFNSQPPDQLVTLYSIRQGHTTHPPYHHPLCTL